jgi:hypothetical protein
MKHNKSATKLTLSTWWQRTIRLKQYISHRAKHMRHKRLIVTLLLVTMVVFAASRYFIPKQPKGIDESSAVQSSQSTSLGNGLSKGTPEYATMLPAGKTAADFGGWTRISPPNINPVFAYSDMIGNISISVSQQPLPDSFKPDIDDQIREFAKSYNANQKITVGETNIYIGTSAKGAQSVIYSKNDLLILIKSSAVVSDDQWATYINSLQ